MGIGNLGIGDLGIELAKKLADTQHRDESGNEVGLTFSAHKVRVRKRTDLNTVEELPCPIFSILATGKATMEGFFSFSI